VVEADEAADKTLSHSMTISQISGQKVCQLSQ